MNNAKLDFYRVYALAMGQILFHAKQIEFHGEKKSCPFWKFAMGLLKFKDKFWKRKKSMFVCALISKKKQ